MNNDISESNGVPALGIRKMSLPAMIPNILSLKHLSLL